MSDAQVSTPVRLPSTPDDASPPSRLGELAKEAAVKVLPPLLVLCLLLLIWELASSKPGAALPAPSQVLTDTMELITDPFYDNGGNDVGLAWQLLASLERVAVGYLLAVVAGVGLGVLIAPTALAAFWITIFGNSAIFIELFGGGGVTAAVNEDVTMALFKTIELMSLGQWLTILMSGICTLMLVTYFVTSADSATLVICTLICMGDKHPAARYRVFWGLAIGAVAAVLLLAGGLKALQTASIVAALPFTFVTLLATYGFLKALREEVTHSDLSLHCESHASSENRTALNSPKPAVAVSGSA